MSDLELTHTPSQMWRAARQEALRWQGYAARVPLFVLTMAALYFAGAGLLRNVEQQVALIQVFILIGYTVLYWMIFTLARLIQGWMRARRARRARFRDGKPRGMALSLTETGLSLVEGDWRLSLPRDRLYSVYECPDFLFLDSPHITWLPIEKTDESVAFFKSLKNKKGGPKAAPLKDDKMEEVA